MCWHGQFRIMSLPATPTTPSLSPKPMIAQSIEDIIICVLMQTLSPNVGYCCSYGLARIDAVMMGFGGNVCQAITLSISVQSCWLLSRNVDHDIIWIRWSRGDIGRRSCYPWLYCHGVLADSIIKTSLIYYLINIEPLASVVACKCCLW